MNIFRKEVDKDKYFIVKYYLSSNKSVRDAAWVLAIGQSVGNPNVRSAWETEELFENHSCIVLGDEKELTSIKEGTVSIAFPVANINFETDGISHFLCQIMGGQLDVDIVKKCHVLEVKFPTVIRD